MKERAIAFDFDGTLVHSGVDKCAHIMYAAYAACATTPFRCFLCPGDPGRDVERLLRALLRYPGAPRLQQPAACVNSLVQDRPAALAGRSHGPPSRLTRPRASRSPPGRASSAACPASAREGGWRSSSSA